MMPDPNPASAAPSNPGLADLFAAEEEQRGLRTQAAVTHECDRNEVRERRVLGRKLDDAKGAGRWARDPRFANDFYAFAYHCTGYHRTAVDRFLALATGLTDAEVEHYGHLGSTCLSLIAQADPRLKADLLERADKLSVARLIAAIRTGQNDLTRLDEGEAGVKKRLRRRLNRRSGAREAEAEAPAAPADASARVAALLQELAAVRVQLEEARARPPAAPAAPAIVTPLDADEHVRKRMQAADEHVQEAGRRAQALLETARAEARQLQAEAEQKLREAQEAPARLAEARAALDRERAALDAREADLARREEALCAREAALAQRFQQAADELREELCRREDQLYLQQQDLVAHKAALEQEQERVRDEGYAAAVLRHESRTITWPGSSPGLDTHCVGLLSLIDHLDLMCGQGLRMLASQTLGRGGMPLLHQLMVGLDVTYNNIQHFFKGLGQELAGRHPDVYHRYLERIRSGEIPPEVAARLPRLEAAPAAVVKEGRPRGRICLGGSSSTPRQFVRIGTSADGQNYLDLDAGTVFCMAIVGLQGYGKTHGVAAAVEGLLQQQPGLSELAEELGVLWCHYGSGRSYPPGIVRALRPNPDERARRELSDVYGVSAKGLDPKRLIALVPPMSAEELKAREAELGIPVLPIRIPPRRLDADLVMLFLGAEDSDALYIQTLQGMLRRLGPRMDLGELRGLIAEGDFDAGIKRKLGQRMERMELYVGEDGTAAEEVMRGGMLVVADMRHPWVTRQEAMVVFAVLSRLYAGARDRGRKFLKLVVLDETQKYMKDPRMARMGEELLRTMRHLDTGAVVITQNAQALPLSFWELPNHLMIYKTASPESLRVLKKAQGGLGDTTIEQTGELEPGEFLVLSRNASDPRWKGKPQKGKGRPTSCDAGGSSREAGAEEDGTDE